MNWLIVFLLAFISFSAQSSAVAAKMHPLNLKWTFSNYYKLEAPSVSDTYNLCFAGQFQNVQAASSCTGFLIAHDLLVTAGHCMDKNYHCSEFKWVFDYTDGDRVLKKNIYSCHSIIAKSFPVFFDYTDYAIIRLDRPVIDRDFYRVRDEGKIDDQIVLGSIGTPLGGPIYSSDSITILDNSFDEYFLTDLVSFPAMSGSPVIDEKSGLVEGIVTLGADSFWYNQKLKCNQISDAKATTVVNRIRNIFLGLLKEESKERMYLSSLKFEFQATINHVSYGAPLDFVADSTPFQWGSYYFFIHFGSGKLLVHFDDLERDLEKRSLTEISPKKPIIHDVVVYPIGGMAPGVYEQIFGGKNKLKAKFFNSGKGMRLYDSEGLHRDQINLMWYPD